MTPEPMSPVLFWAVISLIGLAWVGGVLWLRSWAHRLEARNSEPPAASSFVDEFVPDSSEIDDASTDDLLWEVQVSNAEALLAEAETTALAEECVVLLDDCLTHVERLRRAARAGERG